MSLTWCEGKPRARSQELIRANNENAVRRIKDKAVTGSAVISDSDSDSVSESVAGVWLFWGDVVAKKNHRS